MFRKYGFMALVALVVGITGCMRVAETRAVPSPEASPTKPPIVLPTVDTETIKLTSATFSSCNYPVGWYPYRVQPVETLDSIAQRFNLQAVQLLGANCLADATTIIPGAMLYVPSLTSDSTAHTILPLGISAFAVEPTVVKAGEKVRLTWQGQGPIANVRVGWLYQNQFIEEQRNLPNIGVWEFDVPNDGRTSITFMVRVSDGQQEVAAETAIRIECAADWFFAPLPAGCPSTPMMGSFVEQRFERGTIIYIPTLGISYLLLDGQVPQRVGDSFVPGMPLRDASFQAPQGYLLPLGSIYYAWRQDNVRGAFGYAVQDEITYTGMMQRTVDNTGETIYLMASSGYVYQIKVGQYWNIITPQ